MTQTNGHADTRPVRERLKEARQKIAMLRAEAQAQVLERQTKVLESLWLGRDDWWGMDLWDRIRPQPQTATGYPFVPPSVASDRRHGDNWPLYQTEQELANLRQRSRILTQTGGYGEGLLRNLVNHAVAGGYKYEVISKEKTPDADPQKPGVQAPNWLDQGIAQAQDVIDRWLEKNAWNSNSSPTGDDPLTDTGEQELCGRILQDGEAFVRCYDDEDDGLLCLRFLEPEQITNPPGAVPQDGWSWGIQHQMVPFEDVRTPELYHVGWMDQTSAIANDETLDGEPTVLGEKVTAAQVVHVKAPGTRSTVKRGRPFFSYDTAGALERASKLQSNASWGAAVRSAIAMIWEHEWGSPDQISNLAVGLADYQRTNPVSGKTEQVQRMRPGEIVRVPTGQKIAQLPTDSTQSYLTGVQGDLRQAATAACAPEYLVSADASNANYASTKESGTPFVRYMDALQALLKAAFMRLAWKALRWAAARGLLDPKLLELIDIQIEAPQVVMRDALQMAQEDQILIPLGVKDRKTAAMEKGLDWDTVQANNAEYDEQHGPELPLPDADGNPLAALMGNGNGNGKQRPQGFAESKDSSGHEHDPHSGEFTGSGGGSGSKGDRKSGLHQAKTEVHAHARAGEKLEDEIKALNQDHPAVNKVVSALETIYEPRIAVYSDYSGTTTHFDKNTNDRRDEFRKLEKLADRAIAQYGTAALSGEDAESRGKVLHALRKVKLYARQGLRTVDKVRQEQAKLKTRREPPRAPEEWLREDERKGGQFAPGGGRVSGHGDSDSGRSSPPSGDSDLSARKAAVKQERQHLRGTIGEVFPGAKVQAEGNVLKVRDGNRVVQFEFEPGKERSAVHFQFMMAGSELLPGNMTATGKELQAGTLEFGRKLSGLAEKLGRAGLDVSYETREPRRARLYAAALARAGFEQVKGKPGQGYARWRKKQGETKPATQSGGESRVPLPVGNLTETATVLDRMWQEIGEP